VQEGKGTSAISPDERRVNFDLEGNDEVIEYGYYFKLCDEYTADDFGFLYIRNISAIEVLRF
jgi:hypothetical protein